MPQVARKESVEAEKESDAMAEAIKDLARANPTARERARQALVAAGPAAVLPLIQGLADRNDQVSREAARALGEIGDFAAAPALAEALDHPNLDVRWVAANALIALGYAGLKETLTALLTRSSSPEVRQAAQHVIAHFATLPEGEFLLRLLGTFDAFEPGVAIPAAALQALHEVERIHETRLQNRAASGHFKGMTLVPDLWRVSHGT